MTETELRTLTRHQSGAVMITTRKDVAVFVKALVPLVAVTFSEQDAFAVHLAVEEALVNAVQHGNDGDDSKHVYVWFRIENHGVFLDIMDEGDGFDPASVPDPTTAEGLEVPSGRGLLLMRHYMHHVSFIGKCNRVVMVFRWSHAEATSGDTVNVLERLP